MDDKSTRAEGQPVGNLQNLPPNIPHHEVLRCIGSGSYGEVWLARDVMGVYRAVKVVRRAKFDSDKPYEREFTGLRNFEPISRAHDGLTDILGMGINAAEGYFFYSMEAADDQAGGQIIEAETYKPKTLLSEFVSNGRLPFERSLQIASVLSARSSTCMAGAWCIETSNPQTSFS